MPRKVTFTAEESVKADTRKKQEILRNTKINEQANRDIQTAQETFANPNLSDQQKRDLVKNLESGFVRVERANQLPTAARDPGLRAADMFAAKERGVGVPDVSPAKEQLQRAGAFEEVTPEERSLEPERKFGEGIPLIGAATSALAAAAAQGLLKDSGFVGEGAETAEGAFPTPETPETLREGTLRQLRKKSFDEGISKGETFGTFVESIPVVGSLAAKYASGLIETPSSNAKEVLANIQSVAEDASTGQEKVRNGLEDPEVGLSVSRDMEENIAKLEGRIKLLIITSPILRANTDKVNKIQSEIFKAQRRISRYRAASSFGLTAQLTGTGRIIPTDEQLFFELKGGK